MHDATPPLKFCFSSIGTGDEVYGNCNAPPAVTYSAIIYCLRCMVQREIPLNQGCLAPVRIILPPRCILNPSEEAAVVGGNVLTSQRVTDVVLKGPPFGVEAHSFLKSFISPIATII